MHYYKYNADYQRLLELPGIKPLVGNAVIASVNHAKQFGMVVK